MRLKLLKNILKSRLIERWIGENHTYLEAETRVMKNDLVNADVVNSNRLKATLELQTG